MASPDPARWLDEHGDLLFGYALRRVRRRDVAEDLVQDALLTAFHRRGTFDGRGEVGTWLVGILRHKVLDHYRREATRKAGPLHDDDDGRSAADFDEGGAWRAIPADWAIDPARAADLAELRTAIDDCRAKLPPTLAAAYVLREVDGVPVEQACELLAVTANHLAVRLYRARMLVRACVARYLSGRGGAA